MSTILLTGFEPFGGATINPAAEVVFRLAAEMSDIFHIQPLILPVDVVEAPQRLQAALVHNQPDWCVMLGLAEGRATLSIERVAINLCDFPIPDNIGQTLVDQPIAIYGPDAYFATLPTRELRDAALTAQVPTELSLTAGAYLCNCVMYTALHVCATQQLPTRCGFIHVPALPEQVLGQRKPHPTMALETMCTGVRTMLHVLARTPSLASVAH
jgi:pyroglutamyl-peptidase